MTSNPAITPRSSGLGKENQAKLEVPLDYSFMNINIPADAEVEEPREIKGKKIVRNSDNKYNSKCLKFNNNVIGDVSGLMSFAQSVLIDPEALSWIDLCCNEITKIDPVFCDFPNLQILYLHGNQINDIREVDKLGGMKTLRKLSLHGNPIDNIKGYRSYVLAAIPHLISFDMSTVTKQEHRTADTLKSFGHSHTKKKKRQPNED